MQSQSAPIPSTSMITTRSLKRASMSQHENEPVCKKVATTADSVGNLSSVDTNGTGHRSSAVSGDLMKSDSLSLSQVTAASFSFKPKNNSPSKENNRADRAMQLVEERQAACQQMMLLMSHFSENQLERYEIYRRSKFPKNLIRKVVKDATNHTINDRVAIAIAGIAKVYAGQIVESGLDFMEELKEAGPLRPKHIREAMRRIKRDDEQTAPLWF